MQTFTKTYPYLPEEGVRALAAKYRLLEERFAEHPTIVVPTVHACEGTHIDFVQLPIAEMTPLRMAMCTRSSDSVAELFQRIGGLVAELHGVLQSEGYVHGDLWPGNIYLHTDRIVFLDFEPIHNKKDWQQAVWNTVETDLAHFIVFAETLFPARRWYRYPLFRAKWYDAFLAGYREAGGTYTEEHLYRLIREQFRRNIQKVSRSPKYAWYHRVVVVLYRYVTRLTNRYLR